MADTDPQVQACRSVFGKRIKSRDGSRLIKPGGLRYLRLRGRAPDLHREAHLHAIHSPSQARRLISALEIQAARASNRFLYDHCICAGSAGKKTVDTRTELSETEHSEGR